MGVFDKIKNALFEEEYVEVEEKPKKVKKEKPKKVQKELPKETKPIAKKVVIPEKKEEKVEPKEMDEEIKDEDFDDEPLLKKEEDYKFPMVDDHEFDVDNSPITSSYEKEPIHVEEPRIVQVEEKEDCYPEYDNRQIHPYGIDESNTISLSDYGRYEQEKKVFRPSPIISPIYGVLDKNYKKEEIVNKREVRLTSSYAKENLSVDDVRNKAYGKAEIESKEEPVIEKEIPKKDSLVDLSDDDKPKVDEITVGDAEEYFEDLGLEYNIDYKDASKERATGRRSDKPVVEEEVAVEEEKENSDDNLFDLIDSMYEENNN